MHTKKAIVIGAGFGGMASALRLRNLGYKVTVYDNNPLPGGRAQVYKIKDYKFDAGPTVITAPFLFDELFEIFNFKKEQFIEFNKVEPWYKFIFSDKTSFNYGGTLEDTQNEISKISIKDVDGYAKLVNISQKIFNVGFTELAAKPFNKFSDMLYLLPKLIKLKSYLSVHGLVSKYIKNEKLKKSFCIHPLLVGGNPFNTTSIYCLIHYLERKWGIWFPKGGTGALVNALYKLSLNNNIKYSFNSRVSKINITNQKATGIELQSGEKINADLIVCDGDAPYVYRYLIDEKHRKIWTNKKIDKLDYSMGLFVWYFGTKKKYNNVEHHSIIFGKEFKVLLDKIFNKKELSSDLSLYLHRPTATDKSMAPTGRDAFYVLAPVPNTDSSIDWDIKGEEVRENVEKLLEENLLPELSKNIDVSFYVTPKDFKKKFCTLMGSGFSLSPIFSQSAWFRFHNKSEDIDNLFLCGAGTHPGAGLPGVLSSAKIVEISVPPATDVSIDDMQNTFKAKSRLFSLASLLLPKKERYFVTVLYYVCRKLDDWSDNNIVNFYEAFYSWKNNTPNPILNLYRYLIVHCNLQKKDLSDMLAAMQSETESETFSIKNELDLINYCYGVAGTVGNMFCNLVSIKSDNAYKHAKDLGIAMQLTNIARDVHVDLSRGVKFIPNSYLTNSNINYLKNNYEDAEIKKSLIHAKIRILELAEEYYTSGFKGLQYLPYRYKFVIRWAGLMYRQIGRKILKNPDKYHAQTCEIDKFDKIRLLFKLKI